MSVSPVHLVTVYSAESGLDHYWAQRLRKKCTEILASKEPLRCNYAFDALDLPSHLRFDLLVSSAEDKIIAFGGIYRRNFWPEGVYRFANRTWLDPQYRRGGKWSAGEFKEDEFSYGRTHTRAQIAWVRTRAKAIFLSIEGLRALRRLQFVKAVKEREWRSGLEWKVFEKFVHVAPGNNPASWQQIMYANTSPGYDLAQEPWMREAKPREEWSLL